MYLELHTRVTTNEKRRGIWMILEDERERGSDVINSNLKKLRGENVLNGRRLNLD